MSGVKFDSILGDLREDDGGGAGSGITQAQADARYERSDSAYLFTDQDSATTLYSGINYTSSSSADANTKIVKTVTDTAPEAYRTVYTATGAWANRKDGSLTYTTQKVYSI